MSLLSISSIGAAWLWAATVLGQTSPFTSVAVRPPDSSGHYRLVISGHFHGSSSNRSGYPAATLLAGLDTINALRPNVLLSTGDLFLDAEADIPRYRSVLFNRLNVPLFNAPGNHDAGPAYSEAFGPALQVVRMGADRILILDTERDNGSIKGDQLDTLRALVQGLNGRLFIVSHRPVWAEDDSNYSELFAGNTRSLVPGNYRTEVWPLLKDIEAPGQLFWISGSMAGRAPTSIFFQQHTPQVTFIQSAIRDELRDALLVADIGPDGVEWSVVSLTHSAVERPEVYNAAWWNDRIARPEPFNWRLLPYIVGVTITRIEFFYGLLVGALLVGLVGGLIRRARRSGSGA
ncbi:MAG: hypothetical protein JNL52_15815 [Flavobacteriales bacterium]|nr:hypothetical protein [Flavobacteriales bacterium]